MSRSKSQRWQAEYLLAEGISVTEVSEILDIPKTTVSTWNTSKIKKQGEESNLSGQPRGQAIRYKRKQLDFAERLEHLSEKLFLICDRITSEQLKREDEEIAQPSNITPYLKGYSELVKSATECRRRALAAECLARTYLDIETANSSHDLAVIRDRLLKDVKI